MLRLELLLLVKVSDADKMEIRIRLRIKIALTSHDRKLRGITYTRINAYNVYSAMFSIEQMAASRTNELKVVIKVSPRIISSLKRNRYRTTHRVTASRREIHVFTTPSPDQIKRGHPAVLCTTLHKSRGIA